MVEEQALGDRQTELNRLGFKVLQADAETVIARRRSFYWDCLFTWINYTVIVRRVGRLSVAMMERDRPHLLTTAKKLNPAVLPRGLQSGNAILVIYLADQIDSEVQRYCEKPGEQAIAQFYLPAAWDLSQNRAYSLRKTPLWGRLYYGKFRYILGRLLSPQEQPGREPLAIMGLLSLILLAGMVATVLLGLICS